MATTDQPSRTGLTIFLCVLAALCEGIDLQAAGLVAAGVRPEFHPTSEQLGRFFSASTMGLFIGALIGGRVADRIGRRLVLIVSIALFGLFSLLTAFASDMGTLTLWRLLTGLGLGGSFPILITMVAESSVPRRRSANVALAYAGTPFGGGLISFVAMLLPPSQWRTIFVIGGVVPLLLAPIMMAKLRESPEFARLGAAPATVGETPKVAAGSFLAIFDEGRGGRTILLWVSFFLGLLTLYLLLNWLPTLMVENGLTGTQAAAVQIAFNIGGALAALLIGNLLEGGYRNVSVLITFIAIPFLLLALAKTGAVFLTSILVVTALGCAVLAAQAFLYAAAPACYPTLIRGVGVGAAIAMGRIGSIVGPSLGGWLKAAGHGSSRLLMDLMPIVVLGSLTALILAWNMRRRT
jgi:AAHS family 3-hydroxyphenylpropionic acid transporter